MKHLRTILILSFLVIIATNLSAQTVTELLNKAEEVDDAQQAQSLAQQALDIASKSNDRANMSSAKSLISFCLFLQGKQDEGEQMLANAFELTQGITDPLPFIRYWNSKAALCYFQADYANAIQDFEKANTYCKQLNDPHYLRNNMLSLAECHFQAGSDASVGIDYCLNALKLPESKRPNTQTVDLLNKIAQIYVVRVGDYNKALEYYKKAEALAEKPFAKANIAYNLGEAYNQLANANVSLEYFQKALKGFEEVGNKASIIGAHIAISSTYNLMGQNQKGVEHALLAISLAEKNSNELNVNSILSQCYDNLVSGYLYTNKDEARKWAQKKLQLSKELKTRRSEMQALYNLVKIDYKDNDQTTLNWLKSGYAIAKDINDRMAIDQFQYYLGSYYGNSNNHSEAILFLNEIVDRYEKERASLPEDSKLEYWSWLYSIYQTLIRNQIRSNDYVGTFNSIERSTARALLEKIASKNGKSSISPIDIATWRKNISPEQAVVCYGNLSSQSPTELVVDANTIGGVEIKKNMWAASIKNRYSIPVINGFEKLRAFKKIESKQKESSNSLTPFTQETVEDDEVVKIIGQYRSLLSKPLKTLEEKETIDFLGRRFYQLLILPIEDKLVGKTELLIIPNDEMAFLPFEAFIMPDGRYLVEKYDIRYIPSLSVGNEITNRKYSDNRKPLLAFGNAVYDVPNAQTQQTSTQDSFNELMKGLGANAKEGKSMKKYYDALGIAWENLPGTLAELDAITALIPNANCIKGKDVNEQCVKGMSTKDQLKGYKIIHFATHGIVIPEYQELSAIVLSQDQPNEDGYLRASEIATLNLNADFVNLSACETGLGKIYSGEGVVGLTQSFLLAGANSIAVSLWKVSDQSTMEFQKELYRLVFVEKIPISKAINQVKRTFIKGQYNQPFYWAPFVYYGM